MTDVLITGATGQVGNAIARRLAGKGDRLRALVMPGESTESLPDGVQAVFGDVTDPSSLRPALEGCATVYHVAGLPEKWTRDDSIFTHVNVEGTRNMVDAALAAGVERFVYTSTIDVLVATPGVPFDEAIIDPKPRESAYARSKQDGDRLVTEAMDRGLPAVFLYPAGIYGPAPYLMPGLNELMTRIVKGEQPLLLPGGMAVVYTDDLADGHVRAATQAPVGARYILAESFQMLTDLAQTVLSEVPGQKAPRVMPLPLAKVVSTAGEWLAQFTHRSPEIPHGVLEFFQHDAHPSGARARTELGWSPRPFATGVANALAYFVQRGWL